MSRRPAGLGEPTGHRRGLGPTYRLQLDASFGFLEAARLAPQLASLGIAFAYLSPVCEARPGSTHGYDVTDPTRLREELGGRAGFEALVAALRAEGLGVLLDIVPNHLATWEHAPWWRDVLRAGESSPFAPVFDIDWEHPAARNGDHGAVLLPILGAPLEDVLSGGEIAVDHRDEESVLRYLETELPLAPGSDPAAPLHELLEEQHYRLVHWREPERNYRRFFSIDDLVGVRVEDPDVFALTHRLVGELVDSGLVDALRVDHVDGMADPAGYLEALSELAPGCPIVVEKILTGDETLRSSWPVAGTTGYEIADELGWALADEAGMAELAGAAAVEGERPAEAVIAEAKRLVLEQSFTSEVARVARLSGLGEPTVRDAAVAFPVYRSYVSPRGACETDLRLLAEAGGAALAALAEPGEPSRLAAVLRFQQLTTAAMAKGVEDTAWYRLAGRLAFLEVGGDLELPSPGEDGPARMYRRGRQRVASRQQSLIPGTTHDSKRSADVRARLLALASHATAFEAGLSRLAASLPPRPLGQEAGPAPGPLERRRVAETCLAMAPFSGSPAAHYDEAAERVAASLAKGAREAKSRDSWEELNVPYEEALGRVARSLLAQEGALLERCFPFRRLLERDGAALSLAQVVLRSSLPGVPDCYQGEEVWKFALVDPDNRRPVDFSRLRRLLQELGDEPSPEETVRLARSYPDGRAKLAVTRGCLRARRSHAEAFSPASPIAPLPLEAVSGESTGGLLAFGRGRLDGPCAVAVVTSSPHLLGEDPASIVPEQEALGEAALVLPESRPGPWRDVLSGQAHHARQGRLVLGEVLSLLPVALLVQDG